MVDTVVTDGTVVNPDRTVTADVAVGGEQIAGDHNYGEFVDSEIQTRGNKHV
jgi:hypothetical protein